MCILPREGPGAERQGWELVGEHMEARNGGEREDQVLETAGDEEEREEGEEEEKEG